MIQQDLTLYNLIKLNQITIITTTEHTIKFDVIRLTMVQGTLITVRIIIIIMKLKR